MIKTERARAAEASMFQQFEYHLRWTSETELPVGAEVELRAGSLRSFLSWKLIECEVAGAELEYKWKAYPEVSDIWKNMERTLLRCRISGNEAAGHINFALVLIPPVWAGVDLALSVWVRASEEDAFVLQESGHTVIPLGAGPVERLEVYCRPMADEKGMVDCRIVPEDRFGNPGCFSAPLDVQVEWEGTTQHVTVQDVTALKLPAPEGTGRLLARVAVEELSSKDNIMNGVRQGCHVVVTGNPVWAEAPQGMRPAFGEFHWHTDISGDGARLLEEGMCYARDVLNLDYAMSSDHIPVEAWKRTCAVMDSFDERGSFVALYGWENGADFGHECYYFTDNDHPMRPAGEAGLCNTNPDRSELDRIVKHRPFLAVPHHTNSVAESRRPENDEPFWGAYDWPEPNDHLRLVELMQCRGSQEAETCDDAWRGWHQHNGGSVQTALSAGHKLGFTGGTDNHCGWPTRAFAKSEIPLGANHPVKSHIMTGVWVERLDRSGVFNGLFERRTWAVWDTRALVWFEINDVAAGSELCIVKDDSLNVHIRLSAEDALQKVELVGDGQVIWSESFAEQDIDFSFAINPDIRPSYIYLRALQRNGGLIYASPVFIK